MSRPGLAAGASPKGVAAGVAGMPQRLVFGVGDGIQPAPEYPGICVRRNQSGVVRVRFDVDENGRVSDAQVVGACLYGLLNESARNAILRHWRFSAGPQRLYEVDIEFKLQ